MGGDARGTVAVVALVTLLAACSTAAGATAEGRSESTGTVPEVTSVVTTRGSTATTPTTTTSRPTTTAPAGGEVVLALHPVEALATSGGHRIEVTEAGEILGFLDAGVPDVVVSVDGPTELTFSYRAFGGGVTDVSWVQTVSPESSTITVVQPWRRPDRDPAWHVVAWSRPAEADEAIAATTDGRGITVLSPLTWYVTEDGGITGSIDRDVLDAAAAAGVATWPALAALDADSIALMVRDPEHRSTVARSIAGEAMEAGADGVNLDIEGFREADSVGVSAFIEEVAASVHEWGGVVSYDLVPRSDRWDVGPEELEHWSTAPDRRRIAAAVDFTILMAYDQYNRHRPAGPVAAPAWVEEVLVHQLRYSDPQDVLLGLPAYGRIWDQDDLGAPRAVSLGHIQRLEGATSPDDRFGLDRIDLDDGTFTWDEPSAQSVRARLAADYGLSGVAVWRLGLDSPSLWESMP